MAAVDQQELGDVHAGINLCAARIHAFQLYGVAGGDGSAAAAEPIPAGMRGLVRKERGWAIGARLDFDRHLQFDQRVARQRCGRRPPVRSMAARFAEEFHEEIGCAVDDLRRIGKDRRRRSRSH